MALTKKQLQEALEHCPDDAEIFFSVDFQIDEGGLIAVEHEVQWIRERGDTTSPGRIYLHNSKGHFFNADETPAEGFFMRT